MSGYGVGYFRDVNDRGEAKPNYGKWGSLYVILVDPDTGLPYRASGGGGGGGDASAANQVATQSAVAPATATATKSQMIGAYYPGATPPTFATNQQGAITVDSRGALVVSLRTSNGVAGLDITGDDTDALAGNGGKARVTAESRVYTGTGWARMRGDIIGVRTTPGTSSGTDRSKTVTPAGLSIMSANPSRRALILENNDVRDAWYSFSVQGTAAVGAGNFCLRAGESRSWTSGHVPSEEIFGITSGGNAIVAAREW